MGRNRLNLARRLCALGAAGVLLTAEARAELPSYALVGSYSLPAGTDAFSVMPDGRLIAIGQGAIFAQDVLNSGAFSAMASVDPALFDGPFGNFGASFISMSPDGSKIAIGDNNAANRVHLLDAFSLAGDPLVITPTTPVEDVLNFEAHWHDASTLLVSGGDFGSASSIVRITAPTVDAVSTATVVSNIGGSPGGVTTDGSFLYTGNGFANAGATSTTGEVRAVPLAEVLALTPTAVDFELSALPVAKALSASTLAFDALHNLIIGGGDFAGEQGFIAVVDGDALASALAGGPIAPDSSELHLTPAGVTDFYTSRFNTVTGEILVQAFGSDTLFRYAIVPAPGAGLGLIAGVGFLAIRRRRGAG